MKLFSILTAAACLLVVSACASTPVPTDERVHVMEGSSASVQPGNIYVSADAAPASITWTRSSVGTGVEAHAETTRRHAAAVRMENSFMVVAFRFLFKNNCLICIPVSNLHRTGSVFKPRCHIFCRHTPAAGERCGCCCRSFRASGRSSRADAPARTSR